MYPKLSRRRTSDGGSVYSYVCKMKERSRRARCNCRNADGNRLDDALMERLKLLPEDSAGFLRSLEKSRAFFTGKREEYDAQMEQLRVEHAKKEKIISGLMDSMSLLENSPAKELALRRIEELNEETRLLEQRSRELEELAEAERLSGGEFERLRQSLTLPGTGVEETSVEEKRAAIRALVRKVIWDGVNARVFAFGADEEPTTPLGEDSK